MDSKYQLCNEGRSSRKSWRMMHGMTHMTTGQPGAQEAFAVKNFTEGAALNCELSYHKLL